MTLTLDHAIYIDRLKVFHIMYSKCHCDHVKHIILTNTKRLLIVSGNLETFRGRVQPELLEYVEKVDIYGVKPKATLPPIRNEQQPYSSVRDNPERTAGDSREDVTKGRILLFTERCKGDLGPLMESRLAFVTQKDATKPGGRKVRYISDPRVAINERIEPKSHPRVRVPRHANVIRMVLYWKRRCPAIPVSSCDWKRKGRLNSPLCLSVA